LLRHLYGKRRRHPQGGHHQHARRGRGLGQLGHPPARCEVHRRREGEAREGARRVQAADGGRPERVLPHTPQRHGPGRLREAPAGKAEGARAASRSLRAWGKEGTVMKLRTKAAICSALVITVAGSVAALTHATSSRASSTAANGQIAWDASGIVLANPDGT